jgi:hypothetical protein
VDVASASLQDHLNFLSGEEHPPQERVVAQRVTVEASAAPNPDECARLPEVVAALAVVERVPFMEVADRAGFNAAGEAVATLSNGQRAAQAFKRAGRAPLVEELERFDNGCNEVLGRLTSARATLGEKMTQWRQAEEVLSSQLRLDAEAAAADLNRQLRERAKALGQPEPPEVTLHIGPPPKATPTPGAGGKVLITSRWTYEVTDPNQVPREFCEPSPGLIRAAVNAGVRSIPGVRIFQKDNVGHRGS